MIFNTVALIFFPMSSVSLRLLPLTRIRMKVSTGIAVSVSLAVLTASFILNLFTLTRMGSHIERFSQVANYGNWSETTAYLKNNIVRYGESSYICRQDNRNFQPDLYPDYWGLVANRGETGPKFTWLGAWDNETTYQINDVVSSRGSIYICTATHTNHLPPNSLYWSLGATKAVDAAGYLATSDSVVTLDATNVKTFVLSSLGTLAYVRGSRVLAICTTDNSTMQGITLSYTNDTLVFQADYATSSGSCSNWTLDLVGRVGQKMVWRSTWSSSTEYIPYDVVNSGGNIYVCTTRHTNQIPPNTLYWDLGVSQGDTGPRAAISTWVLRDEKPSGTPGGAASGSNRLRKTLTTLESSPGATALTGFSGSTFTLTAGTYYVSGWSTAYNATVNGNARLYFCLASNGGIFAYGMSTQCNAGLVSHPRLDFLFAPSSTTTVDIRMTLNFNTINVGGNTDYGLPNNDGSPEVYTYIEIVKLT